MNTKATAMPADKRDYVAIVTIGAGSSHGRAPTPDEAVKRCLVYLRDWEHLFKVDDITVPVNVVEVTGYGDLHWGAYPDGWLHGINEATGKDEVITRPIEVIKTYVPARRKRARR